MVDCIPLLKIAGYESKTSMSIDSEALDYVQIDHY